MVSVALKYDEPAPTSLLDDESLRRFEARIEREIRRIKRTAEQINTDEFQRGGDEADLTASRLGQAADLSVLARCADGLAEWTEALDRLRKAPYNFGRCVSCHRPIQLERLEILPTARTCITCQ